MTAIFADTFYFLALINARDAAHEKAAEFSALHDDAIVTTAWVMTELADALCDSSRRRAFQHVVNGLKADAGTLLVPPSRSLFERGMELYNARNDKDWSLTDCISFIIMEEHGITEALTGDRHFEQAGFRALLA
jgi:predicted nucleic acid-binding protein